MLLNPKPLLLLFILLAWVFPVRAQETSRADTLSVMAEGAAAVGSDIAAAEEEALWDAKRNAIEQAAGVFLRARSVGRDFEIQEETLRARSEGMIKTWERVPNSVRVETVGGAKILRLKIRAQVALLPVVQQLADIREIYDELERPRLRVKIAGERANGDITNALLAHLKAQNYEVTTGEHAEVTLLGTLDYTSTVKFGKSDSPFGIGEHLAVGRARLTLRIVSEASEETLLVRTAEATGQSFDSDSNAKSNAAQQAISSLLADSTLTQTLLVRWVREREEGHAVQVVTNGLTAHQAALLAEHIRQMRGFVVLIGTTAQNKQHTIKFLTRLDTRTLRRKLSALPLERIQLQVQNGRGTRLVCIARNEVKR